MKLLHKLHTCTLVVVLFSIPVLGMNRVVPLALTLSSHREEAPIRIPIRQIMRQDLPARRQLTEEERAEAMHATMRLIRRITEGPTCTDYLEAIACCECGNGSEEGTVCHTCCSNETANLGCDPCCCIRRPAVLPRYGNPSACPVVSYSALLVALISAPAIFWIKAHIN